MEIAPAASQTTVAAVPHPAVSTSVEPPMKILSFSFALIGCGLISVANAASPAAEKPPTSEKLSAKQCQATSEAEIAALFERWNDSLKTGEPGKVVANYAKTSVLLPTVSNKVRLSAEEKADYFTAFLSNKPVGVIDSRSIMLGCDSAVDAGVYTFTYGTSGKTVQARYSYSYAWDGAQWLITSHHSSAMPEG